MSNQDAGDAAKQGSLGGPCYANDTCDQDLICVLKGGTGVCALADGQVGLDGSGADSGSDALGEAASDSAVVCSAVSTAINANTNMSSSGAVQVAGYAFLYLPEAGVPDASCPVDIFCGLDGGLVATLTGGPGVTQTVTRPLDHGVPADAGRTINFTWGWCTATTGSALIGVTAP